MNFVVWLILCIGIYIVPSCIGAFINLDWTYLDFTTWTTEARVIYTAFVVAVTMIIAIDGSNT
ncbi:hypothetical protein phiA019_0195 [Aeromonas phage phiA019]|nr:hypothetical protein phiA009_0002 [Aeromonas phage phiA009]ULG01731.1 hypothetical protein phiA019_0195 [Aeromonas phage phiA019]